jgi:O-acetyl-ADP-ribose deacetylase (regulator of RNase III)
MADTGTMAAPIGNAFRLVLVAVDDDLARAWARLSRDLPGVEVHRGSIMDVACDAVVSPANSFGFMERGIDEAYLQGFGVGVAARVRDRILEHHGGELLVGEAEIVETGDRNVPFLICAPTMRIPMRLVDTVNPYLAARAVFRLVEHGHFLGAPFPGVAVRDLVRVLAMPGLGTGTGGVAPETCAGQVRAAFEEVVLGRFTMPRTLTEAASRQRALSAEPSKRGR